MDTYLDATANLYREAALSLCCTTPPIDASPGLKISKIMLEMNYCCCSFVSARDLVNNPAILYVVVRRGMELLQFHDGGVADNKHTLC